MGSTWCLCRWAKLEGEETYHTALGPCFRAVLENQLKRLILRRVVNKTQLLLGTLENTESERRALFFDLSSACSHEYSKVNSFAGRNVRKEQFSPSKKEKTLLQITSSCVD
jgi:hypothetical protein